MQDLSTPHVELKDFFRSLENKLKYGENLIVIILTKLTNLTNLTDLTKLIFITNVFTINLKGNQ